MTDIELLELAAKAAGYELIPYTWDEGLSFAHHGFCLEDEGENEWNPLEDDGDALRLAVSLPSCIVIDGEMKWCGVHMPGERGKYDFSEGFEGDPAAATRRAIVRAAAEIGKTMP